MQKTCTKCEQEKPLTDFVRLYSGKDGVTYDCKDCRNARQTKNRNANRESALKRESNWRENNREYCRRKGREWAKNHPEGRIRSQILKYGITEETFRLILEGQEYRCMICRVRIPERRDQHIDHDHKCCPNPCRSCGKCIRGVLCHNCNVAIGHIKEDPTIAELLAAYLRGFSEPL